MKHIFDVVDRWVEAVAKWLDDNISSRHPLAFASSAISGVDQAPLLPRDRRIGSNIMLMADKTHKVKKGETVKEIAKKYGIKDWKKGLWEQQSKKFLKENPNPDLISVGVELVIPEPEAAGVGDYAKGNTKDCGFWALCNMAGKPCTRCGGDNGFDGKKHKCPSGTKQGYWHAACCKDPGGTPRHIQWHDCCTQEAQDCGGRQCTNYPQNLNWCMGVGNYYCTAVLHDPTKDKDC